MTQWIAVIEDEPDIAELEAQALKKEGFQVKTFPDGDSFLGALLKEKIPLQLVLLDIMLPGTSGIDVLRLLRNNSDYEAYKKTPVIMVSARDTEVDKVLGLEFGADDYVSKPFSPRELTARIKAVIRRTETTEESSKPATVLKVSGITIDMNKFQAFVDGSPVELTTVEFKILSILSRRKGWVFDRSRLIDLLWSGEKIITDRTIDVHIKHLREKLGKYGDLIKTLRGVGYKIEEE
jgi:DNA-binding response OmpR family regulator